MEVRIEGSNRDLSIITDADGKYEPADLPPGRYSLWASKPGYNSVSYGQRRASDLGRRSTWRMGERSIK